MNTQKNIKEKITFLKRYYWGNVELDKLYEKLEKINVRIKRIKSSNFSLTPRGGIAQSIDDLISLEEECQDKIVKKMISLENIKIDIEDSIDTLEDTKLRILLKYLYIDNLSYKEVSIKMSQSERHLRRLHNEAIELVKIVQKIDT